MCFAAHKLKFTYKFIKCKKKERYKLCNKLEYATELKPNRKLRKN